MSDAAPLSCMAAAYRSAIRVSGSLVVDACLRMSTGADARAWLLLHLAPPRGLPYIAHVDLGTDAAAYVDAQCQLVHLRAGAVVSVGADALELAADHGHTALRLICARDVVAFGRYCPAGPAATSVESDQGERNALDA